MLTAEPTGGAGSSLPTPVLLVSGIATVVVSAMSVHLQLRNYRKPALRRMIVRIMIMVPLYAVSSLISLFFPRGYVILLVGRGVHGLTRHLTAMFFIDAIRDIYEAFVVYAFFTLLLSYPGGEHALLILLHAPP
ncbi:organic solute transporter subunit alpha/Transmembrane protein [Mycena olivaceomarginata]|nr:organic solute transporter subunit alpha/Transmembrane protein [Mycena olivaceomarginata]